MTEQYLQDSINLKTQSPTTFFIRSLGDLDQLAPADEASGARVISTPEGKPGIEVRVEGMIELPEGQYIVDDAAPGDQQGVTFIGRSANLDGFSGNVEGGLIVGTNGMNIRRMTVENSNALGSCLEFGNLIEIPMSGIPVFRTSAVESLILESPGGGIRLFNVGVLPFGGVTIGTLIQDVTMRCDTYGIRSENDFTAGVRISGVVNISGTVGLQVIHFTQVAPADVGPLAIRNSSFFGATAVPGEVRGIVFADVSIAAGSLAIEGCGFEAADPSDAIYDLLTAAAVVPGAGSAVNLISQGNVITGAPPAAIAQNP